MERGREGIKPNARDNLLLPTLSASLLPFPSIHCYPQVPYALEERGRETRKVSSRKHIM